MCQAHGRVRGVHALASGTRGAIDIHPDVLVLDPDVHVLRLREHGNRHRGGVDPPAGLGGRHALNAVDTALELQPAPCAPALDEEDDLLEAADAGGVTVHHLHLPPLALRVLRVHPREIGGEQSGLVSARTRADLDEDVPLIVGIPGQEQRPELLLERRLASGQVIDLRLGHRAHLPVGVLGEDVAGLGDPGEQGLGVLELPDHLGQL